MRSNLELSRVEKSTKSLRPNCSQILSTGSLLKSPVITRLAVRYLGVNFATVSSKYSDVVLWSALGGWYMHPMIIGLWVFTCTRIHAAERVLVVCVVNSVAFRSVDDKTHTPPPTRFFLFEKWESKPSILIICCLWTSSQVSVKHIILGLSISIYTLPAQPISMRLKIYNLCRKLLVGMQVRQVVYV